jgi:hypothetical protein
MNDVPMKSSGKVCKLFAEIVIDVSIIALLVSCYVVKLTGMLKQPHHVLNIGYHRKVFLQGLSMRNL